jgi:hypothetical protein
MAEHFKGNTAKNARIKIDYSGVRPDVKFSYPDRKRQYSASMFYPLQRISLIILLLIYTIGTLFFNYSPGIFMTTEESIENMMKCAAQNSIETLFDYNNVRYETCAILHYSREKALTLLFIILFFWLLLPAIVYFPFKNHWSNIYPRYQAFWAKKKWKKFTMKDIRRDLNGKYFCEIPLFENILLNYNATEDFSKYLDFFEIEEHKFQYYNKKKFRGDKRRRRPVNEWLWYARFYFRQRPQKGRLEVTFK